MKKLTALTLLILFFLLVQSGAAFGKTDGRAQEFDKLFTYCFKGKLFNGAVLVAEHGKVVYQKAMGNADAAGTQPLTTGTMFRLASVSKTFTGMAVMMLMEKGKLSYDDPLSKYFPQFPPYAAKITIRHLLTHTSGIANYVKEGVEIEGLTNREVVTLLSKEKAPNFVPGSRYEYSNSGYILLAEIVAKVSGKPYHTFVRETIFTPLGMKDTLVNHPGLVMKKPKATGYNILGKKNDPNLLTMGDGGAYSTVGDLLKWDQALYSGKLVSEATLKEAFTPNKLNNGKSTEYGYGFSITARGKNKIVGHLGGFGGFRTCFARDLRYKRLAIILTNNGIENASVFLKPIDRIAKKKSYKMPKLELLRFVHIAFKESGIQGAIKKIAHLEKYESKKFIFAEDRLNSYGYYLMRNHPIKDALELFKFIVKEHPKSWNAHDSLGEAYKLAGNKEEAIKSYEKSLRLNPKNAGGRKTLEELKTQT